jgi:hypothetical protein
MNEQDVRALVREAIERHLGRPGGAPREPDGSGRARLQSSRGGATEVAPYIQSSHGHASHILLKVLPGSDVDEGMCVIEPAVRCNHCGFCQSYGH